MSTISAIHRYPVKGLSGEDLSSANLIAGQGISLDRAFGLTNGRADLGSGPFQWHPKSSFLMLMRDEKLATLKTCFDETEGTLTVLRDGKQVAKGNLALPVGRAMIEDFFAAFMKMPAAAKPKLVRAPEAAMYSDHKNPVLSFLNMASVRDLERITNTPINPIRFRANVLVEGLEPWAEFNWVGRTINAGSAQFAVTERIDRCGATNVNPESGERDMNIPKSLKQGFNHIDCGVFARVTGAGTIAPGDAITVGAIFES